MIDRLYPRVHITEECMREGMQIESVNIKVADKIRLLEALSETGIKRIVVGAFVSPRYTPQMSEIEQVVRGFRANPDVNYYALALNARGRERRAALMPPLSLKPSAPSLTCHLCDTFVRRNTNQSQHDEIAGWPLIVETAVAAKAPAAGIGINAAFGSNFEGLFDLSQRMSMLGRQHQLWTDAGIPVTSIFIGDPMGWATPAWVEDTIAAIRSEWPMIAEFRVHVHNSRGLGLASTYAAIRALEGHHDLHLDTTAGGIGGCPYCGNGRATGMVATEDLVNMLETMGIDTGVDLEKLIDAVWLLEEIIGRSVPGHVAQAGPHPGTDRLYDPNLPLVETFDEARHFRLGEAQVEHQTRPWREPIPSPARQCAAVSTGSQ